jgi:hypothetical protein
VSTSFEGTIISYNHIRSILTSFFKKQHTKRMVYGYFMQDKAQDTERFSLTALKEVIGEILITCSLWHYRLPELHVCDLDL